MSLDGKTDPSLDFGTWMPESIGGDPLFDLGAVDSLPLPSHAVDIVVLDATTADRLVLPNVDALLKSDYVRSGSDLVLETPDGGEILVLNFSIPKPRRSSRARAAPG